MFRLAFDLGTHCGVAYDKDRELKSFRFDCLDFTNSRHEGGGMRYLKFNLYLENFKPCPDVVYYELVARHKGTAAAHVYGGFLATLQLWCEKHKIPYCGIHVGTIKKHATGKGNAGKQAMINAARETFGYDGDDDNVADALWILSTGISMEG